MAAVNHINEAAESAIQFVPAETRGAWATARRSDLALQRQVRAALDNADPRKPWDHVGANAAKPPKVVRRTRAERLEDAGHWVVPRLAAFIGVLLVIAIVKGHI